MTRLSSGNKALRDNNLTQAIRHYVKALYDDPELVDKIGFNLRLSRNRYRGSRKGRKNKIGVCGWELSRNIAERVKALADLYSSFSEVEIIGSIFPQWGNNVWEPIKTANIPYHSFLVNVENTFVLQALELVLKHPYEVVHLSKPRMPTIIFGLLYKLVWDACVIMDIDEEELSFVGANTPIPLEDYLSQHDHLPEMTDLGGKAWTRIAVGLATIFDGVTVSDTALQNKYGGEIIPLVGNKGSDSSVSESEKLKKLLETAQQASIHLLNLRPLFDHLALVPLLDATKSRQQSSGIKNAPHTKAYDANEHLIADYSKQYEVIKKEFDHAFYYRRYMDIAAAQIDPVKHYLEHGAKEGRNPSPYFDTNYYRKRYADVDNSGVNPFYHYLKIGEAQGRGATYLSSGESTFDLFCTDILGKKPDAVAVELVNRRRDLRSRLDNGVLGEMVACASKLEPLIRHATLAAMNAGFSPFRSEQLTLQMVAMRKLHEAASWKRCKTVVLIPWCHVSGATRVAGHLAVALAKLFSPEEIIVIRTETSELQFPEWFPDGCRHVDLAGESRQLNAENRKRLLVEFLRSLRPLAVFNVNSKLFWDAMGSYGKALSNDFALFSYFFCNDKNINGDWVGYPIKYFHRFFDIHSGIITDSHFLSNNLKKQFQLPEELTTKLITFETPIINELEPASPPQPIANRRPQIFWAGRFDRQKRLDIVYTLAERLPDIDFHLWGEPALDRTFSKLKKPDNVFLQGVYKNFSDLPLNTCDVWLYTSEWDGVPNMLIEVATAAIPVVGSLVGGTGEVLLQEFSWPIDNFADIDAYEKAIQEVLAEPEQARSKALQLRDWILKRRSTSAYRETLKHLLLKEGIIA